VEEAYYYLDIPPKEAFPFTSVEGTSLEEIMAAC